jgi:protein-S-isoprenylcysteine O-methyltransferase Ste14
VKAISIIGFCVMIAGITGLVVTRSLFSISPLVIVAQAAAIALSVWARTTFGTGSFHAAADPTQGGLVTTGPYAFVRNPIYTAALLFVVAGGLAHVSWSTGVLVLVVAAGAVARILVEERLLRAKYPDYGAYAAHTKRLIPYVV